MFAGDAELAAEPGAYGGAVGKVRGLSRGGVKGESSFLKKSSKRLLHFGVRGLSGVHSNE
jgi:hypothetical protein